MGDREGRMGNTWGISGPTFLVLYIVLALVGAVIAGRELTVSTRAPRAVRRSRRFADPPPAVPVAPIADSSVDPFELAYLAGGTDRVATVAIVELVARGELRIDTTGTLAVPTPVTPMSTDDPVETVFASAPTATKALSATDDIDELVLENVSNYGMFRRSDIARSLKDSRAIAALRRRALDHGYLTTTDPRRKRTRLCVIAGAILALGLARLVVGLSRGRPVEFLVIVLIGIGIATVCGYVSVREECRRTIEGSALVLRYATTPANLLAPPMAVAASGLPALADRELATCLETGGEVRFFGRVQTLGVFGGWLDHVISGYTLGGRGGWAGGHHCGCGGHSYGGGGGGCGGGGCGGGCGG
jgi:hypothetical protein